MYSKTEIEYLINAGYTMSEIMSMDTPAPAPAPAPAPVPAPAPAPVPTPAPTPEQGNNNADILAAINNLTQAIQSGNIRLGGFPAPSGPANPDDILANIINPPGYNAGKK